MKKRRRLSDAYLSALCMELGCMLRAGMQPAYGLSLLRDEDDSRASRALLDAVCARLDEGAPLSQAMREAGGFPDYLLRTLALAEKTGRLESSLMSLSGYYERQRLLRLSTRQAVLYPAVLLCIFLAVAVVLLTQVLPIFDRVFRQLGVTLTGLAAWMLNFGQKLSDAGGVIAIVVGILLVLVVAVAAISPLRRGFSAFVYRHFGSRGVWGLIARSRFISALAAGFASGLGAEESVEQAAALIAGCRKLDAGSARCRAALETGETLADALRSAGLLTAMQGRTLALGIDTGDIDTVMEELSRRADREAQERLDAAVAIIEPTIVILTTVLAGVLLLSVMLPLMSVMSGL